MDILLLSRDGLTVYNGPLRLTVPYFMSIGLGGLGRCTEDTLLDIVSSPEASTPLLDGQVIACLNTPLVGHRVTHCVWLLLHMLCLKSVETSCDPHNSSHIPYSGQDILQRIDARMQTASAGTRPSISCPESGMHL